MSIHAPGTPSPENCPTPAFHQTHYYCPSCTWVAEDAPKSEIELLRDERDRLKSALALIRDETKRADQSFYPLTASTIVRRIFDLASAALNEVKAQ